MLRPSYEEKHKLGGRKPNLNIEDTLLMTLTYYRDYPTFFKLGMMFGLDENSEQLVDVTECTIQRPKVYDIQKEYYSGKKKKHTIKIQIIMNEKIEKLYLYVLIKEVFMTLTYLKTLLKNCQIH